MQPFRFENAWVAHDSFKDVLSNTWQHGAVDVSVNFENLTSALRVWSRERFGDIHKRKRRVLARFKGVKEALDRRPNSSLFHLELSFWWRSTIKFVIRRI